MAACLYTGFAADYEEALKLGEAPVAYSRVMFLGPGGSGKSSLLDGLMNEPLRLAESTALADVLNIKYHWVEAADAAEDAWRAMKEEDEFHELASLCHLATIEESERERDVAAMTTPVMTRTALFPDQDRWQAAEIQRDVTKRVVKEAHQLQLEKERQQQQQQQQQQKQLQELQDVQQQQQRQQQQKRPQRYELKQKMQKEQLQVKWLIQQQRLQQKVLSKHTLSSKEPEVVMRIWDCGGQPVFLDILSAFLTSRTMFLLVFDASQPLKNKWQESWRHRGRTYKGKKLNITFLQLMMQWMRLIHASLVAKNKMVTDVKEATCSEVTADRRQPISLPSCPRIMIVGTHGDNVSSKQKQRVFKELDSSCKGKAFRDLVCDKLVIDNTTAGKGKRGDPGYRRIRKTTHEFARSLATPTPLTWISFRRVLQKTIVESPVLSYKQVITVAEVCGIPQSKVPNVLYFYHQLGVFLHYAKINSLSNTIIAEPQWLIKQLCKLLMPEWYHPRPPNMANLWEWLEGKGILLEQLYQDVWRDCELEGGAQALVDLLDHFDLAAEISPVSKETNWYGGRKYFVPCMLKAYSQENHEEERVPGQHQESIRKSATLHIVFNTGYIPPGFFVRLAAQMTKSEKCMPIFERGIYRDSITFCYGEVDRVTITESKTLTSIHVDVIRIAERAHSISHFAGSCVSFRNELCDMCEQVLCWFPSIELDFAFRCSCSVNAGEHFSKICPSNNRDSKLFCHHDKVYQMNLQHKYWLPPAKLTLQPNIEDGKLTSTEIENVAKELKIRGGIGDLAREMEVEYSPEEASPEYAMIADWVMYEKGTRYKLAEHLREAGLGRLSTMLLMGDMESSSNPPNVQKAAAALPQKPSLRLLLQFPTESGTMNIIKQIGTHYEDLGILLLNDDNGEITAAITHECQKKASDINREVLKQWIQGQGKQPVAWETLVEVLKSIDLQELACTIENGLH